MNTHISDDLPRLLTGDATRDVVLEAAAHLRVCVDCQQELVSAVVAHASLTSAHRFAPEVVASDKGLIEELDDAPAGPLPDLSSMFAQVREEAEAPPRQTHRRRNLLAVAAAAVVLAGGGTAIGIAASGSDTPNSRTVSLDRFDQGHADAKAKIVGKNRIVVDATSLPKLDSQHQYEVWLTDSGRKNMQSVGFIGSDNKANLPVTSKVLSQYSDIEVSVQKVNQIKYSNLSVLRGDYR
jgi:hypothetical protein